MYIRHSTDGRSNAENPTSEEGCFGCRIFDIRRTADRMLKIRHPKKGASDVEYSTSEEGCFGCRIFDIRLCGRSNRKNPTSEEERFECRIFDIRLCGRSNRKNPIGQIRRIEFSTFDPTECTRLINSIDLKDSIRLYVYISPAFPLIHELHWRSRIFLRVFFHDFTSINMWIRRLSNRIQIHL